MRETKRKRRSPLLIALLILLGLTVILCATVFGLWVHGQHALNKDLGTPTLPDEELEDSDSSIIKYQGKSYQYNTNMRNILLMGIDSEETPDKAVGSQYEQADVLVLAAMNPDTNQMTLISIPRDAMCDIQLVNANGDPLKLMHTQLALAYAYGNNRTESCELTRDAVSNLFYGLPIQGYAAYYMSGVSALNHAVGGVTVTILDDYEFASRPDARAMVAGKTMKLNDYQAELYIRCRAERLANANELRMKRQKQYMLALVSTAKQMVKENPGSILSLYGAVDDYVLTNLGASQVLYLATQAASMEFSNDLRPVTGTITLDNAHHAECHIDNDALFALMLDVFYTEIPSDATPAVS